VEAAGAQDGPDDHRSGSGRYLRRNDPARTTTWVVKLIDQYPEDDPDAKMRGYH